MIISAGKRHPCITKPRGEVYRRYERTSWAWISLRTVEVDVDLARFNRWQNSTRVASSGRKPAAWSSTGNTWISSPPIRTPSR